MKHKRAGTMVSAWKRQKSINSCPRRGQYSPKSARKALKILDWKEPVPGHRGVENLPPALLHPEKTELQSTARNSGQPPDSRVQQVIGKSAIMSPATIAHAHVPFEQEIAKAKQIAPRTNCFLVETALENQDRSETGWADSSGACNGRQKLFRIMVRLARTAFRSKRIVPVVGAPQ